VLNGMDAFRAGYDAAKRARLALWRRPGFALNVALHWMRHRHSLDDAINSQLRKALWKKITF